MIMAKHSFSYKLLIAFGLIILLLANCSPLSTSISTADDIVRETPADGLSADERATLDSIRKIDGYPLYTMYYQGDYQHEGLTNSIDTYPATVWVTHRSATWACSLFATLVENNTMLFGRNFDWRFSPAVLLFTQPSDGYASAAMVDIEYLVGAELAHDLTEIPLDERTALLEAPFWPFDGMNEVGLVVGMAAVPARTMPNDPDKETIDSLMVMRKILDHAANVEQAIEIIDSYNISWGGGPALHYLIADRSGEAVLVEFVDGERILIPQENNWHLATNHLRAEASAGSSGCRRYDLMADRLTDHQGLLNQSEAMDLLADVSSSDQVSGTQWSILYDMSAGAVRIVMGRDYEDLHEFDIGGE
jgi:hypothetical protein